MHSQWLVLGAVFFLVVAGAHAEQAADAGPGAPSAAAAAAEPGSPMADPAEEPEPAAAVGTGEAGPVAEAPGPEGADGEPGDLADVAGAALAEDAGAELAETPGTAERGMPLPASARATDAVPGLEAAVGQAPREEPGSKPGVVLGEIGYDASGRPGRVHVVVPSDTLWDISDAYLGTPWVWPSIWSDNRDIENPHLIFPGDRIWITPNEMRRVTREEAEQLLAGQPAAMEAEEPAPAAPVEVPPEVVAVPEESRFYRVSSRESSGLISSEALASSSSIVGAIPERVYLAQKDQVYIGLGEGEVEVGDQFTIFRPGVEVTDPDTGRLLGVHVDYLGWLEVVETHEESSLAEIRQSILDIERTDRLIPREKLALDIPIQESPTEVEGSIAFFPKRRVLMGTIDFVYLNRGTLDGLEVGSPLEVYRSGRTRTDTVRGRSVRIPDRVVADLLVVRAQPESSVAYVRRTDTELHLGDRFRGAGAPTR